MQQATGWPLGAGGTVVLLLIGPPIFWAVILTYFGAIAGAAQLLCSQWGIGCQ